MADKPKPELTRAAFARADFAQELSRMIDERFGTTTTVEVSTPIYMEGELYQITLTLTDWDGKPLPLVIDICQPQD